jgi:hypothetical protein
MDGATVITGAANIELVRLAAIRRGLELELNTPLRHSRNMVFNAAKQVTGKKTRKACHTAIVKLIAEKEKAAGIA